MYVSVYVYLCVFIVFRFVCVCKSVCDGCRERAEGVSNNLALYLEGFRGKGMKYWGLSSRLLLWSYLDSIFTASPGGTGIQTCDLLVKVRTLYH